MHVPVIMQAVAGVGAFVAAVGLGIYTALGAGSHISEVSERVRRFLRR